MKRSLAVSLLTALALAVPALRADVKTTQKTQLKVEGILGKLLRGGDGITSTVAVKGDRKSSITDNTGEIIDLSEEKVYRVEYKKKEYKVVTFVQLQKEWDVAQAGAAKNADRMREAQGEVEESGAKMELSVDIKETGQRKSLAGYDVREVVMTITSRVQGKTLEEGGGSVMTSTMWLAPRIAALEEIAQFDMKFMKAVMGESGTEAMQQLAALFALFGSAKPMMEKLQAEGQKLSGTPLQTTTVMERVRSAEEMKAAANQSQGGGGGIGGALARRMLAGRGQQQPRSTMMTIGNEMLTVTTSAADTDVALPAGFKEKK